MYKYPANSNQNGFTLIEMMAMIVISGALTSVAVKIIDIDGTACIWTIRGGIDALNVPETLTWTSEIFASDGNLGECAVWLAIAANLNLGNPHS